VINLKLPANIKYNLEIFLDNVIPDNAMNLIPTYRCNADCEFCYAKGLQKVFPKDLTQKNFMKFFDWMERQNIKNLGIYGGEPTVYPHLKELLEECYKRNFLVQILTNALFDKKMFDVFGPTKKLYFLINYVKPFIKEKERKIFERNLMEFSKRNIKFSFRYNITFQNMPVNEMINDMVKYNVKRLLVGVVNPGYSKNLFIPINKIAQLNSYIIELTKACLKNNIEIKLARPLPLCTFTPAQRKFLTRNMFLRGLCFLCNRNVIRYNKIFVANPDLSVFPCQNLFIKGPSVLSFKNISEINKYFFGKVNDLRKRPAMRKCLSCDFYLKNMCQGGCLSYK